LSSSKDVKVGGNKDVSGRKVQLLVVGFLGGGDVLSFIIVLDILLKGSNGVLDGIPLFEEVAFRLALLGDHEDSHIVQSEMVDGVVDELLIVVFHKVVKLQNILIGVVQELLGKTRCNVDGFLLFQESELHGLGLLDFLENPFLGSVLLEHVQVLEGVRNNILVVLETVRGKLDSHVESGEKVNFFILSSSQFGGQSFSLQQGKKRVFSFVAKEMGQVLDGIVLVVLVGLFVDPHEFKVVIILDWHQFPEVTHIVLVEWDFSENSGLIVLVGNIAKVSLGPFFKSINIRLAIYAQLHTI